MHTHAHTHTHTPAHVEQGSRVVARCACGRRAREPAPPRPQPQLAQALWQRGAHVAHGRLHGRDVAVCEVLEGGEVRQQEVGVAVRHVQRDAGQARQAAHGQRERLEAVLARGRF
jgi:hypothetical protein